MTDQPAETPAAAPADAKTVGDLMSPALAVFRPETTVAEATEALRELTRAATVTYCYVTDPDGKLLGVVVMRDMLLATPETPARRDHAASDPFSFPQDCKLEDALKTAAAKHFPVYPICDARRAPGRPGPRRGAVPQPGDRDQRPIGQDGRRRQGGAACTPLGRSLLLRHPWLQINLLTAFVAAAVVGLFEDTLSQLVILAVFLPVMAGQTGNTGCQALAVTLRGMTLGELKPGLVGRLVAKEAGSASSTACWSASPPASACSSTPGQQGEAHPFVLGLVVLFGDDGELHRRGLRRRVDPARPQALGADPATASSIFLTTASDVASMGMFLSLATMLLM